MVEGRRGLTVLSSCIGFTCEFWAITHHKNLFVWPLQAVQRVFLSCLYTTLDYAQTGLIAAVFFFKMMEWWYQSAEERMSAPTVYPPPPPPPTPKVAKDGIPLPTDKTLCPLCCQKRANPSVLSVSGFVFCYSCIFKSVSQHKRCPVTLMPATVEQIRRLFHDL